MRAWDDDPDEGGFREGDPRPEKPADGEPGPSPRAKKVVALVVAAVLIVTLVLCCVAVGEAGQLFWLRLPPP